MDSLPQLGTAIASVLKPTYEVYAPLLIAREAEIRSTIREEHPYGKHSRQTLDIYYPPTTLLDLGHNTTAATTPRPVLVFLYGGGLATGSKIDGNYANGVTYGNLGSFYARRFGFTVVIPDYRLTSDGARYPSGGEDIQLVLDWVRDVLARKHPSYMAIDLFLMGNSAGGIHLATYLFDEAFAESRARFVTSARRSGEIDPNTVSVALKTVIFLSVPFHFRQAHARRMPILQAYFGKDLLIRSPYGLLQQSQKRKQGLNVPGVSFAVVNGTLDPEDEILIPREDFLKQWQLQDSSPVLSIMIEGHNHISPVLAVGTGIGREEAWAVQLGNFCIQA